MTITDLGLRPIQPGPYPFTPLFPAPFDIYMFFIQSIRDADQAEGGLLLLRWLDQMQNEWGELWWKILELPTLYNVDETSVEALRHVKALAGLSGEMNFLTGGLTDAELRLLVSIAVQMWKVRGTELGIQTILRTILTNLVRVDNWFRFRTLQYEWELGWADAEDVDLWLTDRPEIPTSVAPDAVSWDAVGEVLTFDFTSLLQNREVVGEGLHGTSRVVRILCLPSRETAEEVWTLGTSGNLSAAVAGRMGQHGTPSTNPRDYRGGTDLAEFTSDVRVMDDGTTNRTFVENLIRVMRPALERYFIRYVTFIEDFRDPDWTSVSGGAVFDNDAGTVELFHAAAVSAITSNETGDADWEDYLARAQFKLELQEAGKWGELRFFQADASNFYALRLAPTGTLGVTYSFDVVVAGARSVLASAELPVWHQNVDYTLHVDSEGAGRFQVFLDGNYLMEVADGTFVKGGVGLACEIGQRLTSTYVEVAENPMTSVRVGPPMSSG